MPFWVKIKIILFVIALGPIEWLITRIWANAHIAEAATEKYPTWIKVMALLIMLGILLLIPIMFWFIVLR